MTFEGDGGSRHLEQQRPYRQSPRLGRLALLTVAATLLLTACQATPVVSEGELGGSASIEELREWAVGEINTVREITGIEDEWRMLLSLDRRWPEDKDLIIERSYLPNCTTKAGQRNPAAVQLDLLSDPLDTDPVVLAQQVRDHWKESGWTVSEITPGYYRADRADGAFMTIEGATGKAGSMLSLLVRSPCSSDPSVAH